MAEFWVKKEGDKVTFTPNGIAADMWVSSRGWKLDSQGKYTVPEHLALPIIVQGQLNGMIFANADGSVNLDVAWAYKALAAKAAEDALAPPPTVITINDDPGRYLTGGGSLPVGNSVVAKAKEFVAAKKKANGKEAAK